jgi:hypothetical protein
MKRKADPNPLHARLACGRKVKIQSIEGQTAVVQRLGGWRKGSLAVCPIDKLKPA